jgi:hypothetical protein
MLSNTDVPRQPTTTSPLIIKEDNFTWKGFFVILIIVNFLYLYVVYRIFGVDFLFYYSWDSWDYIQETSHFFVPLVITDFIAVIWYRKQLSPPWNAFFIPLLAINVIFFNIFAEWVGNNRSGGALAGFIYIPFALIVLFLDSIVLSYYLYRIYIHIFNRRAKIIFYIVLVSISLAFLALSAFYSTHH